MNMAPPTTYQAYRRTTGPLPLTIEKVTEITPSSLGADEVLIRIHAVSLNFRDVAMLDGRYPLPFMERGIPASDCAAEVAEIGSGVTDFKVGDRVINTIDLNNMTDEDEETPLALGGEVEGVLSQFAVFKEKHLLHMPAHLSWEEVSFFSYYSHIITGMCAPPPHVGPRRPDLTFRFSQASIIPCAGITAWLALNMPASIGKAKTALLQGKPSAPPPSLLLPQTNNPRTTRHRRRLHHRRPPLPRRPHPPHHNLLLGHQALRPAAQTARRRRLGQHHQLPHPPRLGSRGEAPHRRRPRGGYRAQQRGADVAGAGRRGAGAAAGGGVCCWFFGGTRGGRDGCGDGVADDGEGGECEVCFLPWLVGLGGWLG